MIQAREYLILFVSVVSRLSAELERLDMREEGRDRGDWEEEEDSIELTPKIRTDYDIPPPKFLPPVN